MTECFITLLYRHPVHIGFGGLEEGEGDLVHLSAGEVGVLDLGVVEGHVVQDGAFESGFFERRAAEVGAAHGQAVE